MPPAVGHRLRVVKPKVVNRHKSPIKVKNINVLGIVTAMTKRMIITITMTIVIRSTLVDRAVPNEAAIRDGEDLIREIPETTIEIASIRTNHVTVLDQGLAIGTNLHEGNLEVALGLRLDDAIEKQRSIVSTLVFLLDILSNQALHCIDRLKL